MKLIKLILVSSVTVALLYLFNRVMVVNNNALPPLGKILDPVNGFWANAEKDIPRLKKAIHSDKLKGEVTVKYDERWVPHIFTTDTRDAYFVQGYVTAAHRLWQMEFQTHAASGRLSEILYHSLGDKVLKNDRYMRRKGILRSAQATVEAFESDPESNMIVTAYTEGVNAYIESLSYKDYPVEYKLLDYKPEKWTKLKCAILLKYMADMLTGESEDVALTNQINRFGMDFMNLFYPDFPSDLSDPIIPAGTVYEKDPGIVSERDTSSTDSLMQVSVSSHPFEKYPEGLGSNNWAVSGAKTATGAPMLCNDPHLQLNFPSIWFEMQITTPEYNVYGVTLPGAPAVIIGFNDYISWGVTNGTREVKDWYKLQFNESRTEYLVDGVWEKAVIQKDTFYLRDEKEPFIDEIIHTRFGTVVFDQGMKEDNSSNNLACKWIADEVSNEMFTFVKLNRARNYEEYAEALKYFNCPAQNFVFASKTGDIAIWQQGGLYPFEKGQGRYVQDGSLSQNLWAEKINPDYTPHIKNPERGFVSSANQHPTDATYPYYYNGRFEYFRNRRINAELTRLSNITIKDMMTLQNDNYNLIAAEALPILMSYVSKENQLNNYFQKLKDWNYYNHADVEYPSMFQVWWDRVLEMMFEELMEEQKEFVLPQQYNVIRAMKTHPDHVIYDDVRTPQKENLSDIINTAFVKATAELDSIKSAKGNLQWANYKETSVQHLLFTLRPFSRFNIPIGGGKSIVNACADRWGPSWRMVVSLEKETKAYGVYPGGQSGNPGSRFYDNMIETWAAGEYFELWVMQSENDEKGKILFTQVFFN